MKFDESAKLLAVTFESERMQGLYISENNHIDNFQQNQQKAHLKPMLQAKLWEKVVVSYPLMFYTGVTPDCRQIVVANLADTKQPQRIVTLPNDHQLQNMGNSHTHDRIYF